MLSSLLLAASVLGPSETRELVWPGEEGAPASPDSSASSSSASGGVTVERCDGTRTGMRAEPAQGCSRWKIEWSVGGKVWGVSSATSLASLVKERERLLGYARQSARLFDVAVDPRWTSPTAPLCDTCDPMRTADAAAATAVPDALPLDEKTQTAWLDARVALSRFETNVLDLHTQRIREIARLANEPATAKLAKAYAKQLDAAVIDLAHLQLTLDNAAVFRSAAAITRTQQALEARAKSLETAASALAAVVAKAAARLHAGRYADEESTDVKNRPQLVIAFSGDKVTATLVVGEAESQWFEGNVALDGSILGRSLVAPESGTLACNAHSLECGYVWAPAMLRFADREGPKSKKHLVELWFQQSKWVHAKPFSR